MHRRLFPPQLVNAFRAQERQNAPSGHHPRPPLEAPPVRGTAAAFGTARRCGPARRFAAWQACDWRGPKAAGGGPVCRQAGPWRRSLRRRHVALSWTPALLGKTNSYMRTVLSCPSQHPPQVLSPPHTPQCVSVQPTPFAEGHPTMEERGRTRRQYHTPPNPVPSYPPQPRSPSQPITPAASSFRPSGTWPGWPQPRPWGAALPSCPYRQGCRHCWSGRRPSRWVPG